MASQNFKTIVSHGGPKVGDIYDVIVESFLGDSCKAAARNAFKSFVESNGWDAEEDQCFYFDPADCDDSIDGFFEGLGYVRIRGSKVF